MNETRELIATLTYDGIMELRQGDDELLSTWMILNDAAVATLGRFMFFRCEWPDVQSAALEAIDAPAVRWRQLLR